MKRYVYRIYWRHKVSGGTGKTEPSWHTLREALKAVRMLNREYSDFKHWYEKEEVKTDEVV